MHGTCFKPQKPAKQTLLILTEFGLPTGYCARERECRRTASSLNRMSASIGTSGGESSRSPQRRIENGIPAMGAPDFFIAHYCAPYGGFSLLPPALNQGEGAARLRAAPARARRGRLSIKTPMCRHTALHLGCRFHTIVCIMFNVTGRYVKSFVVFQSYVIMS